jgi:hypothetical protein
LVDELDQTGLREFQQKTYTIIEREAAKRSHVQSGRLSIPTIKRCGQ